jgi:hypothetical protein
MAVLAVSTDCDVLDCDKIAAAAVAAVAVPEDISGLDAAALVQLIAGLTLQLEVAKRVLAEKQDGRPTEKTLSHVDSFAINQERLSRQSSSPPASVPLTHINSLEITRRHLGVSPFAKLEGHRLHARIAGGSAVLLGAVFLLRRRSR